MKKAVYLFAIGMVLAIGVYSQATVSLDQKLKTISFKGKEDGKWLEWKDMDCSSDDMHIIVSKKRIELFFGKQATKLIMDVEDVIFGQTFDDEKPKTKYIFICKDSKSKKPTIVTVIVNKNDFMASIETSETVFVCR